MTTLLEKAFEKISTLSDLEQDKYAKNILMELEFSQSDVYLENKKELERILAEINDGSATLLSHEDVWSKIEARK